MGVQINGSEGNVIATKGTYSGNVTIGGTLTYEDVTNIDSVGLVTARTGIEIGARPGVAASISVDGNMIVSGISTFNNKVLLGTTTPGDSTADDLTIATSGSTGITIRTGTTNQGNIYFADGTAGTSQYAGLISYNHNTNHMFFGTNDGTERVRIDSSGYLIAKADIRLRRTASDNGALYFGDTNNNYIFGSDADDLITFATAGDERVRIDSSGNVNVGSATSTSGLRYFDVTNTSNAAGTHGSLLRLITSNAANTGTTSVDIVKYKDGNFYINNNESSGSTHFYTGGTTNLQIDPNGFCRQAYKYHLVVQRSGNLTGYDAAGSFGTGLIFNSIASEFKSSNLSSCFNTANGLFTVPVTGIYLLEASAYAPGSTFSQGWFTINGSRSAYSDWVQGSAGSIVNCINMVKLSATNTVGFHPHGGGGQSSITINADANHTWMRITFIG